MHMGAYRTLQRDGCVFADRRPESVLWLAPSSIHCRDLSNQWGMGFGQGHWIWGSKHTYETDSASLFWILLLKWGCLKGLFLEGSLLPRKQLSSVNPPTQAVGSLSVLRHQWLATDPFVRCLVPLCEGVFSIWNLIQLIYIQEAEGGNLGILEVEREDQDQCLLPLGLHNCIDTLIYQRAENVCHAILNLVQDQRSCHVLGMKQSVIGSFASSQSLAYRLQGFLCITVHSSLRI